MEELEKAVESYCNRHDLVIMRLYLVEKDNIITCRATTTDYTEISLRMDKRKSFRVNGKITSVRS